MRFLIQRVSEASVSVSGVTVGKIGKGFLVFIGISETDDRLIADKMIKKLLGLRIFEDENGKTNLSLDSVKGGLLLVSQFTLYADMSHGNRPSFLKAGNPEKANALYEYIVTECKKNVEITEKGIFGADMKVSIINQGPFTVLLDSDEIKI